MTTPNPELNPERLKQLESVPFTLIDEKLPDSSWKRIKELERKFRRRDGKGLPMQLNLLSTILKEPLPGGWPMPKPGEGEESDVEYILPETEEEWKSWKEQVDTYRARKAVAKAQRDIALSLDASLGTFMDRKVALKKGPANTYLDKEHERDEKSAGSVPQSTQRHSFLTGSHPAFSSKTPQAMRSSPSKLKPVAHDPVSLKYQKSPIHNSQSEAMMPTLASSKGKNRRVLKDKFEPSNSNLTFSRSHGLLSSSSRLQLHPVLQEDEPSSSPRRYSPLSIEGEEYNRPWSHYQPRFRTTHNPLSLSQSKEKFFASPTTTQYLYGSESCAYSQRSEIEEKDLYAQELEEQIQIAGEQVELSTFREPLLSPPERGSSVWNFESQGETGGISQISRDISEFVSNDIGDAYCDQPATVMFQYAYVNPYDD